MQKALLLLVFVTFFISKNAPAQIVTFEAGILKPAQVTLPERIRKIYLAFRNDNDPAKQEADANGYSSLRQLKSILESTGRYTVEMTVIDSVYDHSEVNPQPYIEWTEVGTATRFDTSAILIVLEKNVMTNPTSEKNQEERLWRIYDFTDKTLRDEFHHFYDNQRGIYNAFSGAIDIYAERIMMHWEWAQRDYFKGGNVHMRAAKKCLETNDWDKAAAHWKIATRDSLHDRKAASNACYNMAVYCELNGNLKEAQVWLSRSQHLGNVLAVYYGRILKERMDESEALEMQLAHDQGKIPLTQELTAVVQHRQSASKLSNSRNFLGREETPQQRENRRRSEELYKQNK